MNFNLLFFLPLSSLFLIPIIDIKAADSRSGGHAPSEGSSHSSGASPGGRSPSSAQVHGRAPGNATHVASSPHENGIHQGQGISRTPSMSRAYRAPRYKTAPMPAHTKTTHATQQLGGTHAAPSQQQITEFMQQNPGQRTRNPPFGATKGQMQETLQRSRIQGLNNKSLSQRQRNFKAQLPENQRANTQIANRVRDHARRNHPDFNRFFSDQFFEEHHFHPFFHHRGGTWWNGTTWNGVSNWLPWGWGYPIYYDDEGYPLYLSPDIETTPLPDTYYQNYSQSPATQPESYIETQESTQDINQAENQEDWLSLGVFAAGKNSTQAAYSDMFVQLTLSKSGDIAGTYYNAATDETHQVEGMVDKNTQEAIWRVSDKPNSPYMTTGIYNLTQDVVTVKVHFPNGTQQNWVLVRVNNNNE